MSFSVALQRNDSEPNRVVKNVTTLGTMTGALKDGTSIINPVIIFQAGIADLKACNYMTIADFNRSYFVTDVRSIRDQLVEVHAHTDVLTSWHTTLGECRCIVSKNERPEGYNLLLNDGTLKTYAYDKKATIPFPQGFSGYTYILAVAG